MKEEDIKNFTTTFTLLKKNYSSVENVQMKIHIPAIVDKGILTYFPSIKIIVSIFQLIKFKKN
jgi:hypothetical protein